MTGGVAPTMSIAASIVGARRWSAVSAVIYWFADRGFDAGRGDFFYLADAFLHGRTWLDFRPGPFDVIVIDGRFYVPFAPFPAIALMPLVAILGAVHGRPGRSPGSTRSSRPAASACAGWLLGRIGVRAAGRPRRADRPVRVLAPRSCG